MDKNIWCKYPNTIFSIEQLECGDGYYDNGKFIKLDRKEYNESLKMDIMDNTQFGKDCK